MHPKLQKKHEKIIVTLADASIVVEDTMHAMENIGAKAAMKEFKHHLKQCEVFRKLLLKATTPDKYSQLADAVPGSSDLDDTMLALETLGLPTYRPVRKAIDKLDELYASCNNLSTEWVNIIDDERYKAEEAAAKAEAAKQKPKGKKNKADPKVLAETVTRRQYDDDDSEGGDDDGE